MYVLNLRIKKKILPPQHFIKFNAQIDMHPKVSKDYFHMLADSVHASLKNLELVCF